MLIDYLTTVMGLEEKESKRSIHIAARGTNDQGKARNRKNIVFGLRGGVSKKQRIKSAEPRRRGLSPVLLFSLLSVSPSRGERAGDYGESVRARGV